jgi:hypothetical protein
MFIRRRYRGYWLELVPDYRGRGVMPHTLRLWNENQTKRINVFEILRMVQNRAKPARRVPQLSERLNCEPHAPERSE